MKDSISISKSTGGYICKVGKAIIPGIFLTPLDATRAALKYIGKYADADRRDKDKKIKRGRPKKEG